MYFVALRRISVRVETYDLRFTHTKIENKGQQSCWHYYVIAAIPAAAFILERNIMTSRVMRQRVPAHDLK